MWGSNLFGRAFGRASKSSQGGEGVGGVPGFSVLNTQYPGGERAPQRYVVAGLDFGTAFTKVVIADKSDSYAVRLRPQLAGIDGYLLPGLLRRAGDRVYELAESNTEDGVLDNLKLALIERPTDKVMIANAAGYLALVLQRARLEFMRVQHEIFSRNRLDWHLNIGLPAESYANVPLVDAFRAVARAAWTLSVSTSRIDPARALVAAQDAMSPDGHRARYEAVADRLLGPDQVVVIPEVVAETASYARSPLRNDGLHLLIDVGAGTLDVNVFKLFVYSRDDRYSLVGPKVLLLGSIFLARHRIQALRTRGLISDADVARLSDEYGGWRVRNDLESELNLASGTIEEIDGPFQNQVGSALWSVINQVRQDFGNMVHDWRLPVPTFVAGGGSADPAYEERVRKLSKDMVRNGQGGLAIRPLPMPERFRNDGIPEGQFHRLAVAYGLAHDPLDLAEVIPSGQIPPVTNRAPTQNWRERYTGAEQT